MKRVILILAWSGWVAEFDVDFAKAAKPCMDSLAFFGDPITRDDESPEATVKAFLQFWGPRIAMWSNEQFGAVDLIIAQSAKWEGIFVLDGTHGIKLVNCDGFRLEHADFDVVLGKEAA